MKRERDNEIGYMNIVFLISTCIYIYMYIYIYISATFPELLRLNSHCLWRVAFDGFWCLDLINVKRQNRQIRGRNFEKLWFLQVVFAC